MPRMPASFIPPLLIVMAILSSWSSALFAAEDPADDKGTKVKTVQHIRPEACKKCHEEIYQQWKNSKHASSTPEKNPLFAKIYERSQKDTNGETKLYCIRCHEKW